MQRLLRALFAALAFAGWATPAFADSLVHSLPTNATSPLPVNSCLYVDQGSATDAKLCSGWAAAFGGLTASLNGSDIPAPATFWTNIGGGSAGKAALGSSGATVPLWNAAGTVSGLWAFGPGMLGLNGATSGQSLLNAPATGGGTLTLPPGTDTLQGIAAVQNVSNKTFTSSTLNCANNTCTVRANLDLTGTLAAANFPALTGPVTTVAGSLATTIAAGSVTSAMMTSTIAAGSCTNCNLSYDLSGRVTVAANGSAGGGSGTVNTGVGPKIAQYASGTGTTVGPEDVSAEFSNPQGGPLALASNAVANSKLATMLPNSYKANISGIAATASDVQISGGGCSLGQYLTWQAGTGLVCQASPFVAYNGTPPTVVGNLVAWSDTVGGHVDNGIPKAATSAPNAVVVSNGSGFIDNSFLNAITNADLLNSFVKLGNTTISLGATASAVDGVSLTAVPSIGFRDSSGAFDVTESFTSSPVITGARTLKWNIANTNTQMTIGTNFTALNDPGTVTGVLKSNGSGTYAAAGCADLTGGCPVAAGTTNQLGYYSSPGTVLSPLTLGTNLSITAGTLNAAGGGGAGTQVMWLGADTTNTNAYVSASTPSGFTVGNGNVACINFTNANTTAATLNFAGTGALGIRKQAVGGLAVLTGVPGEILGGGVQQCLAYQSSGPFWVLTPGPASALLVSNNPWSGQNTFSGFVGTPLATPADAATITLPTCAGVYQISPSVSGRTLGFPACTLAGYSGSFMVEVTQPTGCPGTGCVLNLDPKYLEPVSASAACGGAHCLTLSANPGCIDVIPVYTTGTTAARVGNPTLCESLAAPAAVVQSLIGATTGNGGGPASVVMPAAMTAGNTVVCAIIWDAITTGSTTINTVTDPSNTYAVDNAQVGTHPAFATYRKSALTGSPTTVTVNFTGAGSATWSQIGCVEVSGVAGIDGKAIATQLASTTTATDAITSGNITTTNAGNILLGFNVNILSAALTVGTGFTSLSSDTTGTAYGFSIEKKVTGAAATGYPATFTATSATSGNYATAAVALH